MKKQKYVYPAIFHPEEDGGFSVSFPDLDGCFTCGESLEEAIDMAVDAAAGWLITANKLNEEIPNATDIKNVKIEGSKDFASLISIDLVEYRKKNSKTVKKTLTIPQWLNDLAEENHVNFSGILQEALKEKLHINNQ